MTPDLAAIPTSPGVYIYRNQTGDIIYVGKAINLRRRVSQYFQRDDALGPKTVTLVSQIATIETRTVDSEIEALILEASLIKQYRPKYNSLLRDDRSYLYIVITHDRPHPFVRPAHLSQIKSDDQVFGPFPSGRDVNHLLRLIRPIFPYLSRRHSPKPCLFCHLGLCPGATPDPKVYRQNIRQIAKLFNGQLSSLRRQLGRQIAKYSQDLEYEKAQVLKHQLESLDYITSGWSSLRHLYQQVNLADDHQQKSLHELSDVLRPYFPDIKPTRLECFDISQLGNKYFVGSMSVAIDGQIRPDQYRQFKIRIKTDRPDDQFMLYEVVARRLRHPEWGTPDLLVADGGKPQVTSLRRLSATIPIIGLAKKFETITLKSQTGSLPAEWREINLPQNSSALNLLRLLRDEAHRFANRYRRLLIARTALQ